MSIGLVPTLWPLKRFNRFYLVLNLVLWLQEHNLGIPDHEWVGLWVDCMEENAA